MLDKRIFLCLGPEAVKVLPAIVDRGPSAMQVGRIDRRRSSGLGAGQGTVDEPTGDSELDRRRRVLREMREVRRRSREGQAGGRALEIGEILLVAGAVRDGRRASQHRSCHEASSSDRASTHRISRLPLRPVLMLS